MDGLVTMQSPIAATRPLDTTIRRAAAVLGIAGLLGVVPPASLFWLCLSQPTAVAQRISEGHADIVGLLVWATRTVAGELMRYL
jgi:hypothetical protein